MRLFVPPDLEARLSPYIGAPYRPKGETPDGWDCQGAVRWVWRDLCGVTAPSYADRYRAAILASASGRAERARLIAEELAEWRPVERQPGVVVWLRWMGRSGHVGLMVSDRRFFHADQRCGTVFTDLDDPACAYQPVGWFVPSDVTEIVQA